MNSSRAILCPEQTVGADVGHWGIRPSLRDLSNRSFEPGSQLPGYSRISLWETKAANSYKLQSARRDEKKVFIRCGLIPLKTAGNRQVKVKVLSRMPMPIVWRLDELDRLFAVDFSDDIFPHFRSWHNERTLDPQVSWARLTLAISYATEASLFIQDLNQSPFNVGTRLTLGRPS